MTLDDTFSLGPACILLTKESTTFRHVSNNTILGLGGTRAFSCWGWLTAVLFTGGAGVCNIYMN